MSTAKQINSTIKTMESAAVDLLEKAKTFDGTGHWRMRELFEAAREYARAVNRVTRVRRIK